MSMLQRIETFLAKPLGPLWLGLLALLLCLSALSYGLQADDHLFPWKLERGASPWTLFQIEAETLPQAQAEGYVVWWSSPQLYGRFLRPLASLSHAAEFRLWPQAPWLMRMINALIYAASVLVAALLYRRFAPSAAIASLAALLFAIDDGHAFSAGWIAGRNTLLAALFALLSLWLHVRARERASPGASALSSLCVVLALASAEAGVWALTLLVSYALVMESGGLLARLRSILAPLLIGLVWVGVYLSLHCGFRGSSFYRDPSAPLAALREGLFDLPVWFVDAVGPGGFPFSLLYPALRVRLAFVPLALALFWLLLPGLRSSRACRFFALAFALCLAPLLCTLPTARVLLGPSFGALGWIACSIVEARGSTRVRDRVTARLLLAIHIGLAGLLFVPALRSTEPFANGTERIRALAEPGKDVILIQSPVELLSNYVLLASTLRSRAHTAPRSVHQLYTGSAQLAVTRVDASTLEIEVARGWGYVPIERIFCPVEELPQVGDEVRLPGFSARVLTSAEDGAPQRVRFTFPTPLEAPDRQWLTWQGNRPVPWTPPAIGQTTTIAPLSFFSALN